MDISQAHEQVSREEFYKPLTLKGTFAQHLFFKSNACSSCIHSTVWRLSNQICPFKAAPGTFLQKVRSPGALENIFMRIYILQCLCLTLDFTILNDIICSHTSALNIYTFDIQISIRETENGC